MELSEKILNGRQYRHMMLEVRAAEKPDEEEQKYIVEGYATTFNEPYVLMRGKDYEFREQVDPHAFDECDMSDCIMQYDHEGRVFARVRNNTLELVIDKHGLLIRADLGGTEEGRKLYEEIKGGYTDRMSFGFTVTKDEVTEIHEDGQPDVYLRTIKEIGKLYDVSAVSLPANDGTEISARSYCDGVIAAREAERLLEAEELRKRKKLELDLLLIKARED